VAQIILRKTNSFEIGKIKINSESMESSDGKMRNVSTIEIPVKRNG
jgi:DNA-binding protein